MGKLLDKFGWGAWFPAMAGSGFLGGAWQISRRDRVGNRAAPLLLRQDQQHQVGVRAKQQAAGWPPQYLLSLLNFQRRSPVSDPISYLF